MIDLVAQSARSGRIFFHEEVARDGAQGKTLLRGNQRVSIAKRQSALLGQSAPRQLVFQAGFPSAGQQEFEAVRQVVDEVDCCYVAASGRATRDEADLLIRSVKGAKFGRISIAIPTSRAMAEVMMHKTPKESLSTALDLIDYIRSYDDNSCIDFAFADASRSDIGFVADAALAVTSAGAATVIICDTVGGMFPSESRRFFSDLVTRTTRDVVLVAHMHNDLGFGLVNTLEAVSAGFRAVTGSWLGLGERSGMPPTEQLLFALGYQPELLGSRLGIRNDLWYEAPDLKGIVPLARYVGQATGKILTTTDPIVGPGVNSISTGTPFVSPELFQPYDPDAVLGVKQQILLTSLASKRVVAAVADRLGWSLNDDQLTASMNWVKSETFGRGVATIEEEDLLHFLRQSYEA